MFTVTVQIQHKRSLRYFPSLCFRKAQGFPSTLSPERYQFQVSQPECPAVGPKLVHWTVASCNGRFVVIFIIVTNGSFSPPTDNDLLSVFVSREEGEGGEREHKGREKVKMNKGVCSVSAGSYSGRLCVYLRGCREVRTLTDTQVWLLLMSTAAKSKKRANT